MPYKRLQQHFIIKKQKNALQQNKSNIEQAKRQHGSNSSGQMKRFYREV